MKLRTCAVAAELMMMWVTGRASAQTLTIIDCRPLVGVSVGPSINGDQNGARGAYPHNTSGQSPDLSASVEVPVVDVWSVRGDMGSAAWTFQSHDAWGVPLVRDQVRVSRATVSLIRRTPTPCGYPVRVYGGVGVGAYRYGFRDGDARTTRGGIHVLGGVDGMITERIVLTMELSMDAIGGPNRTPVFSHTLFAGRFTFGARLRF